MEQCPHCGSPHTDGPRCPNCGQSFDELADPEPDPEPAPKPVDDPDEEPPETPDSEPDDGRISRRALLGGAAGSVALLGAGGAGWWLAQGGGEGDGVIQSYVDAMAANNWSRIPGLYYDKAPLMTRIEQSDEFDGFEGYLRQRETLETWRELEPRLNATQESYHITEVSEESTEQLPVRVRPDAVEAITELRQVFGFMSVSVGVINEDRADAASYYDGESQTLPLTCVVVLTEGRWQLWTVRASLVV